MSYDCKIVTVKILSL